jgi:lysyl-tRNA synthetase class 2
MVEWYRCFADFNDVMRDTEALTVAAAGIANNGSTVIRGRSGLIDLAAPWDRLTVNEAFERYAAQSAEQLADDEEAFYRVLVDKVEPQLGRRKPVFLTHYPARMASLARLNPQDPRVAERFEAYIDGVELCNGFSELTDPVQQRERFAEVMRARRAMGKADYPLDERFVHALEQGMPPCGGNALGLDRLIMFVLGARRIDDVIAFVE